MFRLRHIALLLLLIPAFANAQSARMSELIYDEACEANIPTRYAFAIARSTSNFDSNYRGRNGGVGVMAVIPALAASSVPETQRWLDHPPTNVHVAMRVLADLQRQHNNWEKTLTVYRNGTTRSTFDSRRWVRSILRSGEVPPPYRTGHPYHGGDLDDFGYRPYPPHHPHIPHDSGWQPIHHYIGDY